MQLEQQLRDALQRDAAELEPVGPGPDHARRRAFRRKRRVQSGVLVLSAAALAGGTIAVVKVRPVGDGARVQSQPTAAAADLAWRSVTGTVLVDSGHFTTAGGVTYELSTAPGTNVSEGSTPVAQALYATRDGATFTATPLGATPWIGDLSESKGVLYAVSTAPGSQSGATDYKLSTSSNGGAQWASSQVPVDFTKPASNIPLTIATRVQVARGAHTTLVVAEARYNVDLSTALGVTGQDGRGVEMTADGAQVVDYSPCKGNDPRVAATGTPAAKRSNCGPTVLSTHPWSEFGITDPAALHQQLALIQNDGGSWDPVKLPIGDNTAVTDVTATSTGFLMGEQVAPAPGAAYSGSSTRLLSSTDGRTWTPLSPVDLPSAYSLAIAGDRIIGTDETGSKLSVSVDAGATWTKSQDIADLVGAPGSTISGMSVDSGPLGFAAAVMVGVGTKSQRTFLLHSADGATWDVTDLGKVGAPVGSYVSGVTVGADHIDVTLAVSSGDGKTPTKLTTLIGTPKA
jgi:hypothetical protein